MNFNYVTLLPKCFKQFGINSAKRTLLPTTWYYLRKPRLPKSDKPALFTMNILPPIALVWHHMARKHLGDQVDITIFDSSGYLNPRDFPGSHVYKFVNAYAATKSEEFLRSIARHRKIGWLCDDDMFIVSDLPLKIMEREFKKENTAAVSFRPREWWHFEIDGKKYEPISSYCTAFNRDILIKKENLSLKPCDGNDHPTNFGESRGRYDTCDKANELLLKKGYDCYVVTPEERDTCTAEFSGLSGAVMLLYHFKTPEETLGYYREPPDSQWKGNMLHGTLSAMLSISIIQDLYEELTGQPYPLPSLPERSQLEEILEQKKPFLRADQNIEKIYKTEAKLKSSL